MLIVMKSDATRAQIDAVVDRIGELGLSAIPLPGAERTAIGTFGVAAREYADQLESLPGVAEIVLVSRPFKLSSREVRADDTVVHIAGVFSRNIRRRSAARGHGRTMLRRDP